MLVANPIYDSVFKYLLDDNKIARKFLSLLIGKNIETLELRNTEIKLPKDKEERKEFTARSISVFHIDFSARIRLKDGSFQQVIIELQKAKYSTDILRFRRYLGAQYQDRKNSWVDEDGVTHAVEILSIYILGYTLDTIKNPLILVENTKKDLQTGEKIEQKDEFIESVTHESIVVQVPLLKERRKTILEKVLSVFDENRIHCVNIQEEDYPKEYRDVVRRLLQAASTPDVIEMMTVEDEYIAELEDKSRRYFQMKKEREEALEKAQEERAQKEEALKEKEEERRQKEDALKREKDALKREEEERRQKEEILKELEALRSSSKR